MQCNLHPSNDKAGYSSAVCMASMYKGCLPAGPPPFSPFHLSSCMFPLRDEQFIKAAQEQSQVPAEPQKHITHIRHVLPMRAPPRGTETSRDYHSPLTNAPLVPTLCPGCCPKAPPLLGCQSGFSGRFFNSFSSPSGLVPVALSGKGATVLSARIFLSL